MSKKLLKSTAVIGFMTLLSRILGQARETVFAVVFGATAGMDAFLVAFKIPNFMRRLFAEGSFSQAFVPILSEYKTKCTEAEMRNLVQHVTGTLGAIVLAISLFGMVFSSLWILVFAPGFIHEPVKFDMASTMLRITFPYIFFISLTALAGGVMNCFGKFSIPAFTPVLLNVCMIVAVWFFAKDFHNPIMAGAWGVFAGGVVQCAFQLPFLYKLNLLRWPKWGWNHPGVQRIIKLMIPALFGASIAQISLLLDTVFASFLQTGSVSWLNYSDRLMQFPLGIFGIALSTAVLPHLSRKYAQQDHESFNRSLDWAMRLVLMVALPASIGMMFLAGPMVITLFQYRQFTPFDALMSTHSLMAFSFGLMFFIWVKVLVSAYYARQDTRSPVRTGLYAMGTSFVMNAILIWPLGQTGLALSTSIASLVNCSLLFFRLVRRDIYKPLPGWLRIWRATIIANIVMAGLLWYLKGSFEQWVHWGISDRAWHLTMLIVIGSLGYFVSLWLCGIRKKDLVF
jgi:putative peptidoglycan lipid II flippase